MAKKAYIGVDGKARKIKKGYIGVENFVKRALPSGYTQLSHIEATGAQHFDSGVVPAENLRLELAFIPSETGQTDNAMFGASWSNDGFLLTAYKGNVRFHSKGYYIDLTKDASGINTMSCSQTSVTINGVSHAMTGTGSDTQAHTIYLFWVGDQSSPNNKGHYKLLYCKMYAGETLIRDYVPSKNANGVVGLYDMVNNTFGGSATSSAFVAGSSAPSVAHKIKKAYIGIGGVARPCWSGGELAYYGTITALNQARYKLAAASLTNYALFAGGYASAGVTKTVDAYNESLVRSTTNLTAARQNLAGASLGSYVIFGGGDSGGGVFNRLDGFDTSLTNKQASLLPSYHTGLAAASIGSYVIFAGGREDTSESTPDVLNRARAFNSSLTANTNISNLNARASEFAATTIGAYALFGGGRYSSTLQTSVTSYTASLTRGTPTALSLGRYYLRATTVGDYALFVGGCKNSSTSYDTVDVYDSALTRTTATALSQKRHAVAATSIGTFAIIASGLSGSSMTKVVDVYDTSLTRTTPTALSEYLPYPAATSIGNYALIAGWNYPAGDTTKTVEAYTVA